MMFADDMPPAATHMQDNARLRLLAAATRLFCRYGINVIGIDAIVAEANVAKATLYKAYGSKDGLIKSALEH